MSSLAATRTSLKQMGSEIFTLSKGTISLLVVWTAVPSIFLASLIQNQPIQFGAVAWVLVGLWFSSASAGIFNQILDARIDGQMDRTQKRPLVKKSLSNEVAIALGLVFLGLGLFLITVFGHWVAAGIALFSHLFYVAFYSAYLKKRTVQNIVIGGFAGAVGPLIGSAAFLDGRVDFVSAMLCLLIFLWTPPHFWALAIHYRDDYAKAKIPMLPVVKGLFETRRQILIYSLSLLIPVSALVVSPYISLFGVASSLFLTLGFIYYASSYFQFYKIQNPMRVFGYSCIYLLVIFTVLSVDLWFTYYFHSF